jgi:hypothetical protein
VSSQQGLSEGCGWRKLVRDRAPFISAVPRVSKLSPEIYVDLHIFLFLLLRAETCPKRQSNSLGPFSHTCILKASLDYYERDSFWAVFPSWFRALTR